MTTSCRSALLEIQYFVARDFRLDSQLYAECLSDAVQFCNAAKNWSEEANTAGPQRNPLVLPCLYRNANHPPPGTAVGHCPFYILIFECLILVPFTAETRLRRGSPPRHAAKS